MRSSYCIQTPATGSCLARTSQAASRVTNIFQRSSCEVKLFAKQQADQIDDEYYEDVHSIDPNVEELKWNIPKLLQLMDDERNLNVEGLLFEVYHATMEACANNHDHDYDHDMDQIQSQASSDQGSSGSLPAHLSSMSRFMCTSPRDLDHEGQFRVFLENEGDGDIDRNSNSGKTKTSIPPNLLFSMDHPLTFMRQHLSYQSNKDEGGMNIVNKEAVVWCVQEDQRLEYVSHVLDDMPFAQLNMGNFPNHCVVELKLETLRALSSLGVLVGDEYHQDGNDDDNETYQYGAANNEATALCKIRAEDLNLIRSLLSFHSMGDSADDNDDDDDPDEEFKGQQSLMRLIDHAVESARKDLLDTSNEPHLVLVANSITASTVAAALSVWKRQKLKQKQNLERSKKNTSSGTRTSTSSSRQRQLVEDLLHQAITVVTFGPICKNFCDGPAYIHISMYDDNFARICGATEKNPQGGGRDAVYFHAWSPYDNEEETLHGRITDFKVNNDNGHDEDGIVTSLTNHNAHNMNACSIQYLYLIMRINGIASFRDLYKSARYVDPRSILDINPSNFAIDYSRHKHGDLVIPPTIDSELLPAMIRATGGDRWLWKNTRNRIKSSNNEHDDDVGIDDDFRDILPDPEEAKVYLEEFFGYSAYEEIYEICRNHNSGD